MGQELKEKMIPPSLGYGNHARGYSLRGVDNWLYEAFRNTIKSSDLNMSPLGKSFIFYHLHKLIAQGEYLVGIIQNNF